MKAYRHALGLGNAVNVLLAIVLSGMLLVFFTPRVTVESVQRGGSSVSDDRTLPAQTSAGDEPVTVRLSVFLEKFQSRALHVSGDDCLTAVTINGTEVPFLPSCGDQSLTRGFAVDAGEFLHSGKNTVDLVAKDLRGGGQGADATFSLDRGLLLFVRLFIVLLTALIVLSCVRRLSAGDRWVLGIAFVGLLVRFLYSQGTFFDVRAHDLGGHLDYVRFVAEHWSLPPGGGYEYHQAPLYYFLVAPFLAFGTHFGWSETQSVLWIHQFSLLISFFTVLAIVWCGTILFGDKQRPALYLFLAFALLLPRTVMLSGAISNDALILLTMAVPAGYLLRYWQNGRQSDWYAGIVGFCFAFLTKLNAVTLIPAFALSLIRKKESWKSVALRAAASAALVAVLAGWLPVMRALQSQNDLNNVINFGKGGGNAEGLILGQDLIRFTTFNPIGVLQHPYNDPWSDNERRMYYWEYLFRSSLFGEFSFDHFRPLAPILLAVTMVLCGYGLLAFDQALRQKTKQTLPVTVMTLSILAVAVAYAFVYDYSSEQDFRLSPLLAVLGGYFIAQGIVKWKGIGRFVGMIAMGIYGVLCVIFFLTV